MNRQEEGVVGFDQARRGYRDRRAQQECPRCGSSSDTLASFKAADGPHPDAKPALWLDTPVALLPQDAKPQPMKHSGQVCGDCGHRWDPTKWERNPLRVRESKTPRADRLIREALGIVESVTIFTDHESEKPCVLCDGRGHHKDDPDYGEMPYEKLHANGPHGAKTCYHCAGKGSMMQPTAEVNMANANAGAVMRLIGIAKRAHEPDFDGFSSGRWEPHELPDIHRRITKALNVKSRRKGAGRAPMDVGGPGTGYAREIDQGIDDDYLKTRLQHVGHVVHTAIKNGGGVNWG